MVTLERIAAVHPKAAGAIATLRASIDGMHAAHNAPPAKPGHQGLLVSRLNAALGLTAKDDHQPRHVFLEAALGIEGGSSKTLSMAQCNATIWWLDQGGAGWVPHIVQAALMAAGQAVLPDPVVEEALKMGAEVCPTQDNRKRSNMWIDEVGAEKKFWGYVTDTLGLTPNDVYEALGVDSLRASTQTKEQIVEALKARVKASQEELRSGLKPKEALHSEAQTIAWMDVFTAGGAMVNLTARQGATPDDIVANALALEAAWAKLQKLGWTAVPRVSRRVVNGKQEHKGNGKAPVQSTTPPPPPPTTTPTPAPGPTPQAGNAPQAPQTRTPAPAAGGNGNGNVEQITEVRITAPAGKPQVEFWRASRRYPELKWCLGGEALLKLAPALAEAGWTPEHFDTIGGNFTVKWAVGWATSPKNSKWRDIATIEVVG